MNVLEAFIRQAQAHPDQIALQGPARKLTYAELLAQAQAIGSALVHRGLQPADVVAVGMAPVDHIVATLGVAWAGGVSLHSVAWASGGWWPRGVAAVIRDPSGTVPDAPEVARFKTSMTELLNEGAPAVAPVERQPEDAWRIAYSSGTTGHPKAIRFSHGSAAARSDLIGSIAGLQSRHTLIMVGVALPFGMTFWMRELAKGATVAVGFTSVPAGWKAAVEHGADLVVASPGQADALVKAAHAAGGGWRVPALVLAGAVATPTQRAVLRQHVCDKLFSIYGASEVGVVAVLDPELMDAEPTAAGRLTPWMTAQAVDDSGTPVALGQAGLLRLRSPMMASGYILRPDANGADLVAFTDGWFRSRDRAFIREDGVVFLAAREDDVINIGGNKVDPAVIENAIAQAPGVIECAVVPAPRANGSVALVAVVVAQGDFDPAALKQHCREMLPKPLVPHAFVRAPSLPRNEGGKVLRSEVASRLAPGRAEQPGQ